MASFQSKIRWRRPRKRDNETYCSDPFLPTRPIIENSKKIATKFKKLKNIIMPSFQAKIGWKGWEWEKIKIIIPFHSYPTRNRNSKKTANKLKKLKNTIIASFQAKIGWIRQIKRENKNYHSIPFLPDA